jgi:lycopene beta-cyclase
MKNYNYIIAGAGCAGRSLLVHLIRSGNFGDKKILLVDSDIKSLNDRTWCFWEKEPGPFEAIVSRRWSKLKFKAGGSEEYLDISPYQYKMIRGDDFYEYTDSIIHAAPNVTFRQGRVGNVFNASGEACAIIDGQLVTADYIFSSIPYPITLQTDRYTYLLQHFKGWLIETPEPHFRPDMPTLMDFAGQQHYDGGFFYTLPYSTNKALVEFTMFSASRLSPEAYEVALAQYIREQLKCTSFRLLEVEDGVIPMYDHPFRNYDERIIYLGTPGGNTKPSTGYTFRFIQKHSRAIIDRLSIGLHPGTDTPRFDRFRFYDSILLRLLGGNALTGEAIFSRLFRRNQPAAVLKFLDNETSCWEELCIFTTLQKRVFAKETFRKLKGYIHPQ